MKDFSIKYVHGDDVIDSTKDIKKFPLPNKLIVCSFLITDKFIYDDNKTNFYQYHGIRSTKTGVGTRTESPPNTPSSAGSALAAAIDAPVVVGTIFSAAARASRRSFAGASCNF